MIRGMLQKDINAVVELYFKYMPGLFLKKLGKDFIHFLFKNILHSQYALNYIFEKDCKVIGFITATTNVRKLFREIALKNKCILLSDIIRRPDILIGILGMLPYFYKTKFNNITSELLFIVVDLDYRKKKIAQQLIVNTLNDLRDLSQKGVKVATLENNYTVNRLLTRLNFRLQRRFIIFGQKNILYTYCYKNKPKLYS